MAQKSLKQLRDESYQKADLGFDTASVPTDLANVFVNEAWSELYDLIIAMDDGRIFAVNATRPPSSGRFSFLLPSDFYHLCSCHLRRGERYVPAVAADPAKYAELADDNTERWLPQYFIRENPSTGIDSLFLFPESDSADVAITYFPQPKLLEGDNDSLANKASRLEYVTLGAAIRMLSKIERDFSGLQAQQNQVAQRLMTSITNRDFNNPRRIRDISSRFGAWE